MATAKLGAESFRGKQGDTVIYELKGQLIKRSIGVIKKKPSNAQLAVRMGTSLIVELLKPLKPYVELGFDLATKNTKLNPYNKATSLNKLHAIKGIYPNLEIDHSKVILSQGTMFTDESVIVTRADREIVFTWDSNLNVTGTKPTDRIMVLAYCPEKNFAVYSIDNARRNEGVEKLILPKLSGPFDVHVYTSFVAADKKCISDSVYLGKF